MNNAAETLTASEASNLRVGRRIHCILYGGKRGTIYAVHGTPGQAQFKRLMGGAMVTGSAKEAQIDVVWDHGGLSQRVPECICTGVQWSFLDEPDRTQAEIDEALAYAEQKRIEAEEAKKAAERAFVAEVQELRHSSEYAHLMQSDLEGGTDKTTLAGANIRKILKKTFPGTKFSVRKDGYSAFWVTWPAADESETLNQRTVRDAIGKFQTGYYDLHEDLAKSTRSPFNVVFGGVDHITAQPRF